MGRQSRSVSTRSGGEILILTGFELIRIPVGGEISAPTGITKDVKSCDKPLTVKNGSFMSPTVFAVCCSTTLHLPPLFLTPLHANLQADHPAFQPPSYRQSCCTTPPPSAPQFIKSRSTHVPRSMSRLLGSMFPRSSLTKRQDAIVRHLSNSVWCRIQPR